MFEAGGILHAGLSSDLRSLKNLIDNLIRMRTVVLGGRRSRRVSVKTGFILVLILYTFPFRDKKKASLLKGHSP